MIVVTHDREIAAMMPARSPSATAGSSSRWPPDESVQFALRVLRVDRRTQVSTVLTALGVAVATGLVLLLTSLPYATLARAERTLWQPPTLHRVRWAGGAQLRVGATTGSTGRSSPGWTSRRSWTRPRIPLPPGIDRLPAPGEMLQSPELAHLAAAKPAAELADRFARSPAGLLGDEALMFPEQLVVLVGHTPDTMPANAMPS